MPWWTRVRPFFLVLCSLRSISTGLCLKNFEKRAHPNGGHTVYLHEHCMHIAYHGRVLNTVLVELSELITKISSYFDIR